MPATRRGVHTSEFYLTVLLVTLAAVQPYFADTHLAAQIVAAALAALQALGYTASRVMVKRAAAGQPIVHKTRTAIDIGPRRPEPPVSGEPAA